MSITAEAESWPGRIGASSRLELRTVKEDWYGKTSSGERRKLQNRLNQRAHRQLGQFNSGLHDLLIPVPGRRTNAKRGATNGKKNLDNLESHHDEVDPGEADATNLFTRHSSTQVTSRNPECMATVPRVQDIMRRFADHAHMSYVQGTPSLLHLPLLTRYNVSVALERNADIMGVTTEYFDCDGLSPFANNHSLEFSCASGDMTSWPVNMLPTKLQRSKPHHPWVDVFPWPQMRDNMMEAFENPNICDEDEVCRELVEYDGHDGDPMLIVWGDASNPQNWEIGPEFLKKWVWLLRGCEGWLEATNYWRAKRGERPISRRQLNSAVVRSMPPRLCFSEP